MFKNLSNPVRAAMILLVLGVLPLAALGLVALPLASKWSYDRGMERACAEACGERWAFVAYDGCTCILGYEAPDGRCLGGFGKSGEWDMETDRYGNDVKNSGWGHEK